MNTVRLYSNGTAYVSKTYALETAGTKVSIPVRKADLADVVASIKVLGNVSLPEAINYTPMNSQNTSLKLNVNNILQDTVVKLAGAAVEIEQTDTRKFFGKLAGCYNVEENINNGTATTLKIIVLTNSGLVTISEKNLLTLNFTDEKIQEEYNKALLHQLQSIKPDSSFVDILIKPIDNTTNAIVRYACPVAAWKPRYSFSFDKEGKATLIGQAVVDNDTDDDWNDSGITVVTGEPITFNSDIAEARRPIRSKVNLVSETAQGAVNLERTTNRSVGSPLRKNVLRTMGSSQMMLCSAESVDADAGELYESAMPEQAYQPDAEVSEVGDHSIFTSPTNVTIRSKQSAIVPLFRQNLDEAKIVLIYKDNDRPFRAVRFKNTLQYTLGRGECEVENSSDFQGKCVLEVTKPNEIGFLIHAKETGVSIDKKTLFQFQQ